MKYKREIERIRHRSGFVLVKGIVDGSEMGCDDFKSEHCETPEGHYIGDYKTALHICDRLGIKPELASPKHSVCSIGYSFIEDKWFGWSHRATCCFGVGSKVKRGDCAYVPVDMEDARQEAIAFWADESHLNVEAELSEDEYGKTCFKVHWTYSDDPDLIPNEKLRGTVGGAHSYPPEQFGKGTWEAVTMDDAKQMAIDFAEGVS